MTSCSCGGAWPLSGIVEDTMWRTWRLMLLIVASLALGCGDSPPPTVPLVPTSLPDSGVAKIVLFVPGAS